MRKIWLIAWGALTRLARDKKALITLLLMPMVLIGILGSALGSMMDDGKINPFAVLVVNADVAAKPALPPGTPAAVADKIAPTDLGKVLVDEVLTSEQVREVMNVTAATDLDAAKQQVAEGKAVSVIYVPPTFSADILAGKQTAVQVYSDPGQATYSTIVEQIARSFTEQVTTGSLANRVIGGEQAQQFVKETAAHLPKVTVTSSGAKPVKAMQYYAVAMAAMFMVMTGFTRAKEILKERQEGTLSRLLISPTPRSVIVAGQMLGNVIVIMAQFVILVAGTSLIYRVNWGALTPALLLGGAFSLAVAGIGTAAAGLLGDPQAADAAMGVASNIFAALSGSMFPLYLFPDGLKLVAKFTPNYWALQGFLDQMSGLGAHYLVMPVTVLAILGVVSGTVGAWRLASK